MGGIGSGSWQAARHGTVEHARMLLDVRRLAREGALDAGAVARVKAGAASVQTIAEHDGVALRYSVTHGTRPAVAVEDWLQIRRTSCNYGGTRPWFGCPGCGRRVALLYLHGLGSRFRCRRCLRLRYASQRMTEPARMEHRAGKLYERAGTSAHAAYHYKPKWMHWRTFHRLLDEAEASEQFGIALGVASSSLTRRFNPDLYALGKLYRQKGSG